MILLLGMSLVINCHISIRAVTNALEQKLRGGLIRTINQHGNVTIFYCLFSFVRPSVLHGGVHMLSRHHDYSRTMQSSPQNGCIQHPPNTKKDQS